MSISHKLGMPIKWSEVVTLGLPLGGLKFVAPCSWKGFATSENGAAKLATIYAVRALVGGSIIVFKKTLINERLITSEKDHCYFRFLLGLGENGEFFTKL